MIGSRAPPQLASKRANLIEVRQLNLMQQINSNQLQCVQGASTVV